MNREILFRGKTLIGGEWIYGGYTYDDADKDHMITKVNEYGSVIGYAVDPSTVGQFTGLTDSKGNKVFEGDYLHATGYLCKVVFERGCFRTVYEHPEDGETLVLGEDIDPANYTIIGSIHDTHLTKQS